MSESDLADRDPVTSAARDGSLGPAARAGLSIKEYDRRVWDMALNTVHPAAIFVLCQVVGFMLLDAHPAFSQPRVGWFLELGLFAAAFLGAWAVFYSTLLRDAGIASLAVTVLVPLAVISVAVVWLALPAAETMSDRALLGTAALLVGPGVLGWILTLKTWFAAKREHAHLFAERASSSEPRGGGE